MKTPKSWRDVTISQYYNLLEAMDMDWETDQDKAVAMLSALTSISIEDLETKVSIKDLTQGLKDIAFIGEEKEKINVSPTLKLNGRRFVFDMILKESAASTFIDLTEYCKTPDKAKKNIHNIIAVFMYDSNILGVRKKRTIKGQLDIAEYLKNNLTMDIAFGYGDFFLTSYQGLLKGTLDYLDKANLKTAKILKKEAEMIVPNL